MHRFSFEIDLWSCPDFDLGKIRTMLAFLCDIIAAQRLTLEDVTIAFTHRAISPSKLRAVVQPIQPAFFALGNALARLQHLDRLRLRGCIFPITISRDIDFEGGMMLVDLYSTPSGLSPPCFAVRITSGPDRVAHSRLAIRLFDPLLAPVITTNILSHIRARQIPIDIDIFIDEEGRSDILHIVVDDDTMSDPGFVPYVFCLRALNVAIFTQLSDDQLARLSWKNVFPNANDALRYGLLCKRLPF